MKLFIFCILCLSLVSCKKRTGNDTEIIKDPAPPTGTAPATPPTSGTKAEAETPGATAEEAPILAPSPQEIEKESEEDTQMADTSNQEEDTQMADASEQADQAGKQLGLSRNAYETTQADASEEAKRWWDFSTIEDVLRVATAETNYNYPLEGTFCNQCSTYIKPVSEEPPNTSEAHIKLLEQPKMKDIPNLLKLTPAMPQLSHIEQYLPYSDLEEDSREIDVLQTVFLCVNSDPKHITQWILAEYYKKTHSNLFSCFMVKTNFVANDEIAQDPYSKKVIAAYSTYNVLGCREPLQEIFDFEESFNNRCLGFQMYVSFPEVKSRTLHTIYK